jgi:hypothetical protein
MKARLDSAFGDPGLFPTWRGAPLESVDYNATITVCAVPPNSMHRQVDGRYGIEFGPLNISKTPTVWKCAVCPSGASIDGRKKPNRSPPVSIVTSLTALARCLRQSNAGNNMRAPVFWPGVEGGWRAWAPFGALGSGEGGEGRS